MIGLLITLPQRSLWNHWRQLQFCYRVKINESNDITESMNPMIQIHQESIGFVVIIMERRNKKINVKKANPNQSCHGNLEQKIKFYAGLREDVIIGILYWEGHQVPSLLDNQGRPVVIAFWPELDTNSDVLSAGAWRIYLCRSTMETKQEEQREAGNLDDAIMGCRCSAADGQNGHSLIEHQHVTFLVHQIHQILVCVNLNS